MIAHTYINTDDFQMFEDAFADFNQWLLVVNEVMFTERTAGIIVLRYLKHRKEKNASIFEIWQVFSMLQQAVNQHHGINIQHCPQLMLYMSSLQPVPSRTRA